MSRSYKKHPFVKDSSKNVSHRYKGKTLASRAVRRNDDIPNGKSGYKKVFCSWNISDYCFFGNQQELIKEWDDPNSYIRIHYKNYTQALWNFKKAYMRK